MQRCAQAEERDAASRNWFVITQEINAGRSVLWDRSPQTGAANEVNCEGDPSPATPEFVQGGPFV